MLKLRSANIVITAEAHNPSIISPDWVSRNLSLTEQPSEFVHTSAFSLFDSASFRLTVDPRRWELIVKVLDERHVLACAQAAQRYVTKLKHIPYKGVGLNYSWAYSPKLGSKRLPQVRLMLDELDPKEVFKGRGIRYSGTIVVPSREYITRVTMDYQGQRVITFDYNFHHEVKDWSVGKIGQAINHFPSLMSRSKELTKSMVAGGKK